MMTESQMDHKDGEEVYHWIQLLQDNPNDQATQEKLILKYKDLIESIAMKYSKNNHLREDLIQVGMIGLFAAVKRYDKTFGKSFESFAIPTIIGEIKRFIRDKTWSVHVPRRIKELGPRIKKAVDVLTTMYQRSPTVQEIANYLEASEEEILETMEMSKGYYALSVDKNVDADLEGGTVSLIDLIGYEEGGYNSIDNKLILEKILPILSVREQKIIKYTYFENLSQKETGERLGISQMHVSRLQRRALRKLREAIQSKSSEVFD